MNEIHALCAGVSSTHIRNHGFPTELTFYCKDCKERDATDRTSMADVLRVQNAHTELIKSLYCKVNDQVSALTTQSNHFAELEKSILKYDDIYRRIKESHTKIEKLIKTQQFDEKIDELNSKINSLIPGRKALCADEVREIVEDLFEEFRSKILPCVGLNHDDSCGSLLDFPVHHRSRVLLPLSKEIAEEVYGRTNLPDCNPTSEPLLYVEEENVQPIETPLSIDLVSISDETPPNLPTAEVPKPDLFWKNGKITDGAGWTYQISSKNWIIDGHQINFKQKKRRPVNPRPLPPHRPATGKIKGNAENKNKRKNKNNSNVVNNTNTEKPNININNTVNNMKPKYDKVKAKRNTENPYFYDNPLVKKFRKNYEKFSSGGILHPKKNSTDKKALIVHETKPYPKEHTPLFTIPPPPITRTPSVPQATTPPFPHPFTSLPYIPQPHNYTVSLPHLLPPYPYALRTTGAPLAHPYQYSSYPFLNDPLLANRVF